METAIQQFSDQLLRLGKDVDKIVDAAEQFPNSSLIQAYAAAFFLYAQTAEGALAAKEYLDRVDKMNVQEKSLVQALTFWQQTKMSAALNQFEKHCEKWPQDRVAIKMAEYLFYCKGQKFESHRFLKMTNHCYPHLKDNPLFLSIHSFAQELNGHYEESKTTAEYALSHDADNPWAHHTLSHYYINKGYIDEGLKVLETFSQSWPKFNRMIESHNMWHLALMYLENLDFPGTLNVYKRADWKNQANMIGEEVDAAALLWRLDMEGEGDEKDWKDLAKSISDHANYCTIPFVSAHLVYSLKRGQREDALKDALEKMQAYTHTLGGEDLKVWNEVGMPLAYGALAYADQDYQKALDYFDPMIESVGSVGGSDAQIDLFHQTYLKSLIGAKQFSEAKHFLNWLTQDREKTLLEKKWEEEIHI